jgi:dynactin 1
MRDMSLLDKTEISKLKKQSDELTVKLAKLSKDNETLKTDNTLYLSQINELKDQVTATLGSVEMIEQLTLSNLDLESKIDELKETIADLEAINEVNDQLQESAREEEKELRRHLDISETRIREAEKQIELLKYNLADQEKTILKFREKVKLLSVSPGLMIMMMMMMKIYVC